MNTAPKTRFSAPCCPRLTLQLRTTLRSLSLFILSGLAAAVPSIASLQAAPLTLDSLYAFGDSFVEVGNHLRLPGSTIPPPPYHDGRFADGPIWIDFLAERAGLSVKPSEAGFDPAADRAVSFAYGGAGTGLGNPSPAGVPVPGVLTQVELFRSGLAAAGRSADPGALYVLWGGSNDYLLNVTSGPVETVGNLATAVESLFDAGARNFLVPNLPDMGKVPIVVELGLAPLFTDLTLAHNGLLAATLAGLEESLPGADIATLDAFALFNEILADPAAFGFSSGVAAGPAAGCIFHPFVCDPNVGQTDAFFWDEVHPSSAVHRLIAEEALGIVQVPEPASLLLVGIGLMGMGLLRRGGASSRIPRNATGPSPSAG